MKDEFEEFFPCAVQKMNDTSEPANKPLITVVAGGKIIAEEVPPAPLLHDNRPPTKRINKYERPEHRAMIELTAQGYSPREISKIVGRHEKTVHNTLHQPLLQQTLVDTIRRVQGEDEEVVELIKANVVLAVKTAAEIMVNPKARDADRLAAAEKFLERRYGKANQPINRGTDVDLNALSDADLAKMCPRQN